MILQEICRKCLLMSGARGDSYTCLINPLQSGSCLYMLFMDQKATKRVVFKNSKGPRATASPNPPAGSTCFSAEGTGLTCSSSWHCVCSSGTGSHHQEALHRRRWLETGCSGQFCRTHLFLSGHQARWPHDHLPGWKQSVLLRGKVVM